jgi:tRNA 2-selenouridine synthase
MVRNIDVASFVEKASNLPVLDVRSPGEYKQGHIPGAVSFPLFEDSERAEVGTLYKQVGQLQAVERGLEIVGGKMKEMFTKGLSQAKESKIMVHCWRGGKRSESVANLLAVAGLEVFVLKGGYKAYRNWVLAQFELPWHFMVLGGMTGVGKTRILQHLRERGEAVLDIEGLAQHRGSAFGRLGQLGFASPQQFENGIAEQLRLLSGRKIWIEDESRVLGSLTIPTKLWDQKLLAPVYMVSIPQQDRIRLLIEDYGDFDLSQLAHSIKKISKSLGGIRTKQALEMLEARDQESLVQLLLQYYDKLYLNNLEERKPKSVQSFNFDRFDLDEICEQLVAVARASGD